MLNYARRCKECDSVLWSEKSKKKGKCPECEAPDEEQATCLEDLIVTAQECEEAELALAFVCD